MVTARAPEPAGRPDKLIAEVPWRSNLRAVTIFPMNPRTGLTLRLLGPLIEVICLIVLLRVRDQGRTILGIPAEYPLYAGLAVGFALVVIGLTFARPATRRPRDSG